VLALACQSLFTIQTSWMGSLKDCDDDRYVYTTPPKPRCRNKVPGAFPEESAPALDAGAAARVGWKP
jgi:hypothetical protein